SCTQGGASDNLCDARMPLWCCGLHVWLDDLLKEHRVSIPSCFALCHCFAPDSRTDEQLRVLGKHGKDTRFIRFNEPIRITDNFHASIIHLYTKLYNQTIPSPCTVQKVPHSIGFRGEGVSELLIPCQMRSPNS